MKIKTIKQITSQDWDKLVIETYGKHYCFQQQDGCKPEGVEIINTSEKYLEDFESTEIPFEINGEEMGVTFKTWLDATPEEIDKHFAFNENYGNELFWERNFYPHVSMIANDLYKKGLLEDGEYQIVIAW